jgi:formylglycine-generating enzyme required for sulfatase activity
MASCFTCGANEAIAAIAIDTVPIGNPGNVNDPATGNLYGGVPYNYRMGKYDVTIGQYTAFLNAVAATDTYNLYNPSMATNLNIAGISQSCIAGSCSYSVIGSPNHPITYVSWGDAARFSNWLHNGQPTGVESSGTTETGAYTLNGAVTIDALQAIARNGGAKWFIPTENEWYKAAFYDPAAGHYWIYATGSNMTPTSAPAGSTPNTANFHGDITGFAVTGSTSYSSTQNYLTDVGAYTASASPYGTFDQDGNVFQWNEAVVGGSFRGMRGGDWGDDSFHLSSSYRVINYPKLEDRLFGFRLATVPEPVTGLLAILACGCGLIWRTLRWCGEQSLRTKGRIIGGALTYWSVGAQRANGAKVARSSTPWLLGILS